MKKIVSLLLVVTILFAVSGCAFADVQMYSYLQETYGIEVPDFLAFTKGIPSNSDNCEIKANESVVEYFYPDAAKDEFDAYEKFLLENGFVTETLIDEEEGGGGGGGGEEYTLIVKVDSKGKVYIFPSNAIPPDQGMSVNISFERITVSDKAEKGSWFDTCGDLFALDYPEYLESLKDESGFLFGRSTYHLGKTEKNSRIIAETGLGYFEDGYGPVIKGLQLGKFATREELKTLMEGMYGEQQITDEYNWKGKQIRYELSLGNSSRGRLVVLLAVGDDEVGFRISLIRIPPAIFGGQNLGIRDFAQEIVNHYPVGTLNLVNLGNGETRYFSEVSDSYNNGWYASIEKYGVVLANSIFSKAVERVQQNRKNQMTFD